MRPALHLHDERAIALLVIDPDPDAIAPWLTGTTRGSIELTGIIPAPDWAPGPGGLQRARTHAGGRGVVRLPLDGPRHALALALRGLHRWLGPDLARTAVVPEPAEGPPPPEVVELVGQADLLPGIDLVDVEWVTPGVAWLTGRKGRIPMERELSDPRQSRGLADLVLDLGLFQHPSPAAAWATSVSHGSAMATRAQWSHALRASYIETCLAAARCPL